MRFIVILAGVMLFTIAGKNNKETYSQTLHPIHIESAADATIKGKVVLPPASRNSERRFRGSAYRNRGSENTSSRESSTSSRYLNTIISAHPTSYEITDLPVSDSVMIIQENAEFIPSVTPVTIGSTVHFVNNDPFYHNVFSLTPGAKFNIGRRPTGDVYSKEVPPTEWKVVGLGPINLFCDIHSQMNAVILSLDTPYFTRANEDGTFELAGLPEGTYELRVYNKDFDLHTQKITVASGEQYEVNLNLMN